MKKKYAGVVLLMAFLFMSLFVTQALAEGIMPYASEEINSISLVLSSKKKIVYNVLLTSQNYTVSVTACKLYKKSGTSFSFVCDMPDGIPSDTNGNMRTSCDISSYITSSGTYQVKATIKAGSSEITSTSNSYTYE